MAIQNYPVWTFEPNWSGGVSEMLEWLTDVMASPDGSEQRRSLRYFPRRSMEFATAAEGDERQLLDNMLISFGGSTWYLPLWHEVNVLDATAASGATFVASDDARAISIIRAGSIVCLIGDDPYTYELAEIESRTPTGLNLVSPLVRTWPEGTRMIPVRSAELTDQPQLQPRTSNLVTAEVRFRIMDAEQDAGGPPVIANANFSDVYREFYVLTMEPDYSERLGIDYERNFSEIDNSTATPWRTDEAKRPFTARRHTWTLEGRDQHAAFARMLQLLRGRSQPLWVPTFMDDFTPVLPIAGGGNTIVVDRCGFTAAGGPRWDREDIMIETVGGMRIYRRITGSTLAGNGEIITLDRAFEDTYPVGDIVRISFMAVMRLAHDSVEIDHSTDTHGVSTVSTTFRSAPDTRIPLSAFNE